MNLVYWELNTRHTLETWGNFWRYLTWINLYVGTCTLVLTEQKTTVGWLWQNQTWKNSWYLLFTWREWHRVPNASPPWFGIISKKEQFKGNLPATFLEGEIQMYLGEKKAFSNWWKRIDRTLASVATSAGVCVRVDSPSPAWLFGVI